MIRQAILDKALKSKSCKEKLIGGLGISYPTCVKYLRENHPMLTTIKALRIIAKEFDLQVKDVIMR